MVEAADGRLEPKEVCGGLLITGQTRPQLPLGDSGGWGGLGGSMHVVALMGSRPCGRVKEVRLGLTRQDSGLTRWQPTGHVSVALGRSVCYEHYPWYGRSRGIWRLG